MRLRFIFALVMLWSTMAFAQAKPLAESLTDDAKAAYQAGKLLFVDGDFAGAEIKFKAAYDVSHDARLLWNMAACEKSLRHYARTDALVREYLDKGAALITDQDRADAKQLLDLIDSFTVKLTITVSEPDAEVLVDDVSAGKSPLAKPVVVDIGTRKIDVRKDGFKPFEQSLPVGGAATAKLDVKLTAEVHEGDVHITAQAGAQISIDGKLVGVGRYDGKVSGGGHTLRVEAAGMKPYQTELVVNAGESRTIETPPLEKAPEPPKPKLWWPTAETALSIGAGEKFNAGGATFFDTRLEIGLHFGAPTELSLYVDVGSIDPGSNNCGTHFHGPQAAGSGDFDVRYAFHGCTYVKPGLQFALHFLPRSKVDVWTSIDAGFSGTFISGLQLDPLTGRSEPITTNGGVLPGIEAGARLGVDYHPLMHAPVGETRTPTAARWAVGVFASFTYTIIGNDGPDDNGGSCCAKPPTNNNTKKDANWPWLLFGARTSLTF